MRHESVGTVRGVVIAIVLGLAGLWCGVAQGEIPDADIRSLTLPTLTERAKTLCQEFGPGSAERTRLANGLIERYEREKTAGRLAVEQWTDLIALLGSDFRERPRRMLQNDILQSMAPDAKTIGAMTFAQLRNVCLLVGSLAKEYASGVAARWIEGSDAWQQLPLTSLAELAEFGQIGQCAPALRVRIFKHVTTKFLSDPAAVRSLPAAKWRILCNQVANPMWEWHKVVWRKALQEAFLPPRCPDEDVPVVADMLGGLGYPDAVSLVSRWVAESKAWTAWEPAKLGWLISCVNGKSDAECFARDKILDNLLRRYLSDEKAIVSLTGREWYDLLGIVRPFLDPPRCQQVCQKLENAFAERPGDWAHVDYLLRGMRESGYQGGPKFVAQWMKANPSWKALSALSLSQLAGWAFGESKEPGPAWPEVAACITAKFVNNPDQMRSVSGNDWSLLVRVVGQRLPADQKALWVAKLRDGFAGRPMRFGDLYSLHTSLRDMGDKEGQFGTAWVMEQDAWRSWNVTQLFWALTRITVCPPAAESARKAVLTHIGEKHLADNKAIESLSLDEDWYRLVEALHGMLSQPQRELWDGRLRVAFAARGPKSPGDMGTMLAILQMLSGKSMDAEAVAWMTKPGTSESLPLLNMQGLEALANALAPSTSPEGQEACLKLAARANEVYFTNMAPSATVVERRQAARVAKALAKHVPEAQRTEWLAKVKKGLLGQDMSSEEMNELLEALRELGDKEPEAFLIAWLDSTKAWASWHPDELATLAKATIRRENPADCQPSQREIALRALPVYLADKEAIREAHCWAWVNMAKVWQPCLPAKDCRLWSAKLWSAFRGEGADLMGVPEGSAGSLLEAVELLGTGDMKSLFDKDMGRRKAYLELMEAAEPSATDLWRDASWELLFWDVTAAAPANRKAVWDAGVRLLPPDNVLSADQIMTDLADLFECLGPEDSLSAVQVLADLVAIAQNSEMKEALSAKLTDCRWQACMAAMPKEARDAVLRARSLADARRGEALELYAKLAGQEEAAGWKDFLPLAGVERIRLAMLNEPVDLKAADAAVGALAQVKEAPDSPDVWDACCRMAFRRVAQAAPEGREGLWAQALASLPGRPEGFRAATWSDLEALLNALGEKQAALGDQILVDLLLQTPDGLTMRRLAGMRVNRLTARKNWQEAKAASLMEIILANGAAAGPAESLDRCLGVFKAAGASAEELQALEAWCGAVVEKVDTKLLPRPVDPALQSAAEKALKNLSPTAGARQKGYLCLFAGRSEEALQALHAALAQSPETGVAKALEDIATAVAVIQNNLSGNHGFTAWLAATSAPISGPVDVLARCEKSLPEADKAKRTWSSLTPQERAEVGTWALSHRTPMIVRWGQQALAGGNTAQAGRLWAQAIGSRPEAAAVTIGSIVARNVFPRVSPNVGEAMEEAGRRLQDPLARHRLLCAVGRIHYQNRVFADAVRVLDEADKIAQRPEQRQDMSLGLIRVTSLAMLSKYEDALGRLAAMAAWPGPVEDRAKAMFLQGWIQLKNNDEAKAVSAFEDVIRRYPNGIHAAKASKILEKLKRM